MNEQVMYWIGTASNRPQISTPMEAWVEGGGTNGGLWMLHNYVKQVRVWLYLQASSSTITNTHWDPTDRKHVNMHVRMTVMQMVRFDMQLPPTLHGRRNVLFF
jgi:hypothetical protein